MTREEWLSMSRADREMYVGSLLGAEKVKDAKGGSGKRHPRPAAEYVDAIDGAYGRGDRRTAAEIFSELER